jgi:hypothetical protein
MTTYLVPPFVPSSTTTKTTTTTMAAQVELFGLALIDGTRFARINHSIVRTGDDGNAEYVVELVLPGFNESLFSDPSTGSACSLAATTGMMATAEGAAAATWG